MEILKNVLLAEKVWFETGGKAEYFTQPISIDDCLDVVDFSHKNKLKITILGLGANVLVSDDGINGLVIQPKINTISCIDKDEHTVMVTAGSGVTIEDLINYCLDNSILGLEEFSGIPSTVGGAAYINLHYFQFFISQFITSATILDLELNIVFVVDLSWFEYGYDTSKLLSKKYCLLDATFTLKKCSVFEAAYARGRSHEIIRHRKQRYPYKGTCGSFFRNFHPDEVTIESNGKKMIYAAYYLDKIGLKGSLKIGNAGVSYQHANMIVNLGGAYSSDIISVARFMQEKVKKEFNIILKPECELLGFKTYPLL